MSSLTIEEISNIKERIWQGFRHEDIAEHFLLDPSTISRIRRGKMFGHIPWTDGSTGPLPDYREKLLKQVRYEERKARKDKVVNQSHFEQESQEVEIERETPDEELHRVISEGAGETKEDIINDAVTGLVSTKPLPTHKSKAKPLSNTELTELDKIGMELDIQATDDLSKALQMADDGESEEGIQAAPTVYEKHKWDYVWRLGQHIPIVVLAEKEDDKILKEAICIVFKGLPLSQWTVDSVPTMIGNIRDQLKKEREDG